MQHRTRDPSTSKSARSPFVFDVRALGRRAGASRATHRSVPAPGGFGTALIGVPEGAELELDIRFEAVMEGVLVSGTVRARLTGECARCLDPLASAIEVEFQELFCYLAARDGDSQATEEAHCLDGDLLDLESVCRDAVLLALPLSPLCSDDCPGLCAGCGGRLADLGVGHRHGDSVDPRWAALRLLDTSDTAAGPGPRGMGRDHAGDLQED